jgi:hypothetical protein
MRGNIFQKVSYAGWVWFRVYLGPERPKHFLANQLLGWILPVVEWHMSNISQNKSIIQKIKVLSTLSNRGVKVA